MVFSSKIDRTAKMLTKENIKDLLTSSLKLEKQLGRMSKFLSFPCKSKTKYRHSCAPMISFVEKRKFPAQWIIFRLNRLYLS